MYRGIFSLVVADEALLRTGQGYAVVGLVIIQQ